MSGTKSRNKGKNGEREGAKALGKILGTELRRGVQYHGGPDSPDVVGLDGLHVEVKRTESTIALATYKAIEQAKNECGDNIPFVMSRRNNRNWLIVIEIDSLVEFCEKVCQIKEKSLSLKQSSSEKPIKQ